MNRNYFKIDVYHTDERKELIVEGCYERTGKDRNYIEVHAINNISPLAFDSKFKAEVDDLCLDYLDQLEEYDYNI
jgi:hypothetical protein